MTIINANCLTMGLYLAENSVDAIVTDPPYELGFMGKAWDASGIANSVPMWAEALRVLKPGGHLLAFSGSRTYHRMVCAIEDAGFEVRDQLMWVYGSGFPKSLDVSKAIDKAAGAERGRIMVPSKPGNSARRGKGEQGVTFGDSHGGFTDISEPVTDAARQWEGWGTALKPAHEPIVLARKPLIGTVAANVLAHGTGALNIDGCRVGAEGGTAKGSKPEGAGKGIYGAGLHGACEIVALDAGRWPANLIHDGSDEVLAGFPADAARFFYCPKASQKDRNSGLDSIESVTIELLKGESWESAGPQVQLLVDTELSPPKVIGAFGAPLSNATEWSMMLFGSKVTDPSPLATTSTIETRTNSTTSFTTLSYFQRWLTSASTVGASGAETSGGSPVVNAESSNLLMTTTSAKMASALGAVPAASRMRLKISASAARSGHPTVKPTELMRYLCRLITPPGGTVLDPFAGSGSTGKAAALEGFEFIGFELSAEYAAIAEARIAACRS